MTMASWLWHGSEAMMIASWRCHGSEAMAMTRMAMPVQIPLLLMVPLKMRCDDGAATMVLTRMVQIVVK